MRISGYRIPACTARAPAPWPGGGARRRTTGVVAMEIIGLIIAGLIIGLLGKFVAPGARDNTPLWLTLLCGIGGVLIGYYVSGALGVAATPGIDWTRWIISIIVAAVLVVAASSLTGRNSRAVR